MLVLGKSNSANENRSNTPSPLPYLSVVIPIYNEQRTIRACIESIKLQNYPLDKYEILAINGGSTDETTKIIENELLNTTTNLRLLNNPKKIQAAALNIGIKESKGSIIIRLDAHSLAPKEYFRNVASLMESTGADHLGGIFLTKGSGIWGRSIATAMSHKFGVGNSLHRTSTKDGMNDLGALGGYRKSSFEKFGGFDEDLRVCEDCEYGYRVIKAGGIVYRSGKLQFTYFARQNLLGLFKQYYLYGFYKIKLMRKLETVPKLRHVIPLAFVINLITAIVLILLGSPFAPIFASTIVLYLAMVLFYSSKESKNGIKYVLPLSLCFMTLHVSYGIGSIVGISSWIGGKLTGSK